jgi:hypothetical protein
MPAGATSVVPGRFDRSGGGSASLPLRPDAEAGGGHEGLLLPFALRAGVRRQ